MSDTRGLTTCLWFDGNAQDAAEYYLSVFKNSARGRTLHYTNAGPGPAGSVLTVEFELNGQRFPERAERATRAMYAMKKIDLAAVRRAHAGE
ncbi:VOC family protein [Streptomyces sp. NPDC007084]|uniref:VOC family protein n=1 Tax=Streptomyces sp. NPDC007084 TaxID=3154313 RepID=UPI00345249C3